MRRVLTSLVGAVVLATAGIGPVAAVEPVAINITAASLVANGAGVQVSYEVVCQPLVGMDAQPVTALTIDYGTVNVDQAVSKKFIAHGGDNSYKGGATLACDGETVNAVTGLVLAEAVPFKKGPAIIRVHLSLADYVSWAGSEFGDAQVTMNITR